MMSNRPLAETFRRIVVESRARGSGREAQIEGARDAFLRYGKGRHPARLNFADCASYALAKSRGIPLLFKGNDFAQTDIGAALT